MPTREFAVKRKFEDDTEAPKIRKAQKTSVENAVKKKLADQNLWSLKQKDEMADILCGMDRLSVYDEFIAEEFVEPVNLERKKEESNKFDENADDCYFRNYIEENQNQGDDKKNENYIVIFREEDEDEGSLYKVRDVNNITEFNAEEQGERFETLKEEETRKVHFKSQKAFKTISKQTKTKKSHFRD